MRVARIALRAARAIVAVVTFPALLSGCGGGGGGDGGSTGGNTPPPQVATYSVGGTVSGLAGQGFVVQLNGGGNLGISSNGTFTFGSPLVGGAAYSVSVLQQPGGPAQTCAVSNGSGTIPSRGVTDVSVVCTTRSFSVTGTVSGLQGTLVLHNQPGDPLTIVSNGSFTFATPVLDGSAYQVTVAANPANQQCSVASGAGTVASANVSSIQITCVRTAFTVGGVVTGLLGTGLTLQNNAGSPITVDANTSFAFPATAQNGAQYSVTVQSAPAGHSCAVVNGAGTVAGSDVGNIQIVCSVPLTLAVAMRRLDFSWPSVAGATSYELWGSESGAAPALIGTFPASQTTTSLDVVVHRFPWATARYHLLACRATCTLSSDVTTAGTSPQAIGYFKASNTGIYDDFGMAVALSADGTVMAVGAPTERSAATGVNGNQADDSAYEAGAVYVFIRSGSTWVQQAYIKASNTEAGDQFGASLDLSDDGNMLAVGAPWEDSSATGVNGNAADNSSLQSGAAYVFVRVGSTWIQQAYFKASNTAPTTTIGGFFGNAVALSGDASTLAVASRSEASNATGINGNQADTSMPASGAVYVFRRSGSNWSQQAYIKASNTDELDSFGESLGISGNGNTLVVGAPIERSGAVGINGNQNDNSAGLVGAVYVFVRASGVWAQQSYIKPSNTYINGNQMGFGRSVGLSADGNTLAVGAPAESSSATLVGGDQFDTGMFTAGAAYLFARAGNQWSQSAYVKASNTEAGDFFGHILALSGDGSSLVVGSVPESSPARGIGGTQGNNLAPSSGAAYLYVDSGSGWQFGSYIKASNTYQFQEFATSIALSADGQLLAIGARREQSNATGIGGNQNDQSIPSGAVYLY